MNQKAMDLTKDPILKTMLMFSTPIVLSFLLQSVYSLVDLFVVGHYAGTFALAGVNMGSQITDFIAGIAFGLLSGGRVIIAQYIGNKKEEEAKEVIMTMFLFVVCLALVLMVIMLLVTTPVLRAMQTPAESYEEARHYYMICMSGIVFIFGYNTVSSILNALGDSKTPLYFVILATGINIVLDFVLVGGLHFGAGGAALATVFAQGVSFVTGFIHLKRRGILPKFTRKTFHINSFILKEFLRIGLPSSYQDSILNISLVVVIAVANTINVYAAAAVGVCAKLNVIFILPVIAMSASLTVIVGQNVGAGRMDRVKKSCWINFLITAGYSFLVLGVFWNFGNVLLELFTNDTRTITMGSTYLKGHCWDYFLVMPAAYCVGGLFTGTGHTGIVALANTAGAVSSRIPLCILLTTAAGLGVIGIGFAFPISTLIVDIVYGIFLLKGAWKKSTIRLG